MEENLRLWSSQVAKSMNQESMGLVRCERQIKVKEKKTCTEKTRANVAIVRLKSTTKQNFACCRTNRNHHQSSRNHDQSIPVKRLTP
jgi:hypothetical protein